LVYFVQLPSGWCLWLKRFRDSIPFVIVCVFVRRFTLHAQAAS
jgi:hypothetical protein